MGLDNYIHQMRSQAEDPEKLANKLSDDDKSTLLDAVKESQEWLDSNPSAEKEEYEE